MSRVVGYRSGQDRNESNAFTHTYAMTAAGNLWPMCGYGWNRSDGTAFSIFRGSPGTEGDCIICQRNVRFGRRPLHEGWLHKTKWL